MYKLLPNDPLTNSKSNMIFRVIDNTWIPMDEANTDYQEYLAWIAEGNQPLPADEGAA